MAEIFHDGTPSASTDAPEKLEIEFIDEPGTDDDDAGTPTGEAASQQAAVATVEPQLPADFDENADPTDEELAAMPEGLRKRAQNLLRKRRSAERKMGKAHAERDEALRIAQASREQLAQMRDMIKTGEQQYLQTAKSAAEIAAAHAQAELRDAFSAGDADKIAAAQRKLTAAQLYASQTQSYRPVSPDVEARVGQLLSAPITPADVSSVDDGADNVHPETQQWFARNQWFNSDGRMRAYAMSVGAELEAQGVDPAHDAKQYFGEIDKEMRLRFPEKFSQPAAVAAAASQRQAPASPVAGAQPSSSVAPKRVQLPKGARAIAERLGISIEDYAREYIARSGG